MDMRVNFVPDNAKGSQEQPEGTSVDLATARKEREEFGEE